MPGRSKVQWERVGEVYPQYANGLDPEYIDQKFTENPEIMWRIIVDVYDSYLRDEERARGEVKVGRRPKPDWVPIEELITKVFPEPYETASFPEALAKLVDGEPQRKFAARVPCSQSLLSEMLNGKFEPDFDLLAALAKAGGKQPYFFAEWRALYLGRLVAQSYMEDPRRSISAIRVLRQKIQQDRGRKRATSVTPRTRSV